MRTPLRMAVEGLLVQPDGRCTEEQVVAAAPVTLRAVRGYLRRLTGLRVVRVVEVNGMAVYSAGPALQRWLDEEPRTRPGGASKVYLEGREQRDEQKLQDWKRRVGLMGKAFDR